MWDRALTQDEILENMRDDEGRSGSDQFGRPGKAPSSAGLVAYWRFDEGAGYSVRDETGGGNDLLMSGAARWEVVPWLALCGDGWVQGLEECDDGNARGGDGCGADCLVEDGWECTGREASRCRR